MSAWRNKRAPDMASPVPTTPKSLSILARPSLARTMKFFFIKRNGFGIEILNFQRKHPVCLERAPLFPLQHNAPRGMKAKRVTVAAQTPRSRMRHVARIGNACCEGVCSIRAQNVFVRIGRPSADQIRAKSALSEGGRSRDCGGARKQNSA